MQDFWKHVWNVTICLSQSINYLKEDEAGTEMVQQIHSMEASGKATVIDANKKKLPQLKEGYSPQLTNNSCYPH